MPRPIIFRIGRLNGLVGRPGLLDAPLSPAPAAVPFTSYIDATCKPPLNDVRQLYLAPVVIINALAIISASVQLRDPTFQNQQVRQQPLVNTAQGSSRALLSSAVITLPTGQQQLASAPAFVYQPVD